MSVASIFFSVLSVVSVCSISSVSVVSVVSVVASEVSVVSACVDSTVAGTDSVVAVVYCLPQATIDNPIIKLKIVTSIFLFIIFLSFVICFSFLSVDINVPYFVLQWINLF